MKRFLILILALIMAAAFGSGCKEEETESVSPVVLRDFETYNPDFMSLQMSTNFGKIEVNTDEKFVSGGNQSARFEIRGGYYFTEIPSVNIPFYSTYSEYNYGNLTEFSSVDMKVYNDENYDIPMYWKFTFFDGQSSPRNTTVLSPGWNDVSLKIDYDILNMFYSLDNCNGLTLEFDDYSRDENGNFVPFDKAPVLYLDDVILYPSPTKYSAPDVDIILDPYEICSFEKAYQAYIMKPDSEKGLMPETKVVTEENGVVPTQGTKMLKASFARGSDGYARLTFSSKLTAMLHLEQYIDNADEYAIAYDIYNASNTPQSIATYFLWGGIKEWPNPQLAWGLNMEAENTAMPMGQWTNYRIPLSKLYEWDERTLKEGVNIMLMFNDGIPEGGMFYLDNFRIEKFN